MSRCVKSPCFPLFHLPPCHHHHHHHYQSTIITIIMIMIWSREKNEYYKWIKKWTTCCNAWRFWIKAWHDGVDSDNNDNGPDVRPWSRLEPLLYYTGSSPRLSSVEGSILVVMPSMDDGKRQLLLQTLWKIQLEATNTDTGG
jgi:hypothetical protein